MRTLAAGDPSQSQQSVISRRASPDLPGGLRSAVTVTTAGARSSLMPRLRLAQHRTDGARRAVRRFACSQPRVAISARVRGPRAQATSPDSSQSAPTPPPVRPYWRKWKFFAAAFGRFYDGVRPVSLTPDEQWTLFEMPASAGCASPG